MIDVSNYYSGGYFLVRAGKPDWHQLKAKDLLPDKVISLSNHIAKQMQVTWGWIPGNPEAARNFGISEPYLEKFLAWCHQNYLAEMDYVSMFYSVDTARQFIQQFLVDTPDLFIIGAGLHTELEARDWRDEPTSEKKISVLRSVFASICHWNRAEKSWASR